MIEELYRFVYGATVVTYTSAQREIEYDSETYTRVAMKRTKIEFKSELSKQNVEISLPIKNPVGEYLLFNDIEIPVTVSIIEKEDAVFSTIWTGRLIAVKPSKTEITLVFESLITSLKRNGLNLRFQRTCPHSLYMRGCFVDAALFQTAGVLTTIVNPLEYHVTEAAGFPDGYFVGGGIQDSEGNYRYIAYHYGVVIGITRRDTLIESEVFLSGTTNVTLFAGCDKTVATCRDRFNNLDNYGGFPFLPNENPFSSKSII